MDVRRGAGIARQVPGFLPDQSSRNLSDRDLLTRPVGPSGGLFPERREHSSDMSGFWCLLAIRRGAGEIFSCGSVLCDIITDMPTTECPRDDRPESARMWDRWDR